MHKTLEYKMGAMSGCFSSHDKQEKEGGPNKGDGGSPLGDGGDQNGGKQSNSEEWDNSKDDTEVIPANLFFWSDYNTDFDGTPNYKEIVDPKYDAILMKCATAPADWQVPDLRLPMASHPYESYYPPCSRYPITGRTTSLPCIQLHSEGGAWLKSSSLADMEGGGSKDDDPGYQQAYLRPVGVTYRTAVQVSLPQAARVDEGSTYSQDTLPGRDDSQHKHSDGLTVEKRSGMCQIPWELPEEEVTSLRDTSHRYLMQFEHSPAISRHYSCSSVRSDHGDEQACYSRTKPEESDGPPGVRPHYVVARCSSESSAPLKDTQAVSEKTFNPDLEYFKLQFAPLLASVCPSHGVPDDSERPWLSDDQEGCGYYPELLEEPQPRS